MKRLTKITRYIIIGLTAAAVGLIVTKAATADAEAGEQLKRIDSFIASHELRTDLASTSHEEPETVSLSYEEWKEKKDGSDEILGHDNDLTNTAGDNAVSAAVCGDLAMRQGVEPDIYAMDVWTLGSYLYGISELDTTRSLILISYEGYGDSILSYYVAAACWTRATNGYLGAGNIYQAFGGLDPQYDLWMDSLGWDDYAVNALRDCYLNPTYVTGCNGCDSPESWMYAEDTDCGTIYVW